MISDALAYIEKDYFRNNDINMEQSNVGIVGALPEMDASDERDPAPVDMTPWVHAKNVSYGIMASTVGIYLLLTVVSN